MTCKVRQYRDTASWEVDIHFTWPDGRTHRSRVKAPVTSRSGALRWGEAKERELFAQVPQKKTQVKHTLNMFFPLFMELHCRGSGLKDATVFMYEEQFSKRVQPFIGTYFLEDVTQLVFQELKAKLVLQFAPSTVNSALRTLWTMFSKAVEWGYLVKKPFKVVYLPDKKVPPFYDLGEYGRLINAAVELIVFPDKYNKAILGSHLVMALLGGDAGLRSGEILALTWRKIDFERKTILIDQNKWRNKVGTTKGLMGAIPMTKQLIRALEELKARKTKTGPNDPVLSNSDESSPVSRGTMNTWGLQLKRKAGLKGPGLMHVLRHTYCSHLVMRGASVRVIQELARHTSILITMKYMHLSNSSLSQAVALLDARYDEPRPPEPEVGGRPSASGFGEIPEKEVDVPARS